MSTVLATATVAHQGEETSGNAVYMQLTICEAEKVYTPPIEQPDWSECYNHGTSIGYDFHYRGLQARGCVRA